MDTKELLALVGRWRGRADRAAHDGDIHDNMAAIGYRAAANDLEPIATALCAEVEALRKALAELVEAASDVRPYCADIEGVRQIARLRAAIDAAKEPK